MGSFVTDGQGTDKQTHVNTDHYNFSIAATTLLRKGDVKYFDWKKIITIMTKTINCLPVPQVGRGITLNMSVQIREPAATRN